MKEKEIKINYPNIGVVLFESSAKAKRLNIRIKSGKSVRVAVPRLCSIERAKKFFESKIDWVSSHIDKEKSTTKVLSKINIRNRVVEFKKWSGGSSKIETSNNNYIINIPQNADISVESYQILLKKVAMHILKFEAKKVLFKKIQEFSLKTGLAVNQVRIKNMKTRWGSCSGRNNINLSVYLALLPDELIDYVIFHELAHIKEKNHSEKFWNLLNSLYPNCKFYRKQLRNYSPEL